MKVSGKGSQGMSTRLQGSPEGGEGTSHADSWGNIILGRDNSKCKGPEAEKLIQPPALQRPYQPQKSSKGFHHQGLQKDLEPRYPPPKVTTPKAKMILKRSFEYPQVL